MLIIYIHAPAHTHSHLSIHLLEFKRWPILAKKRLGQSWVQIMPANSKALLLTFFRSRFPSPPLCLLGLLLHFLLLDHVKHHCSNTRGDTKPQKMKTPRFGQKMVNGSWRSLTPDNWHGCYDERMVPDSWHGCYDGRFDAQILQRYSPCMVAERVGAPGPGSPRHQTLSPHGAKCGQELSAYSSWHPDDAIARLGI